MRPFHFARVGALACALTACAAATAQTMNDSTVPPAVAQQQKQEIKKGAPARWSKPDTTKPARVRTQKKEIAAAFREQKAACRQLPKSERSQCQANARLTYENDMSTVRELVANAPAATLLTRTVVTTEVSPGVEATGASQGGATQGAGGPERQGMQQQGPQQQAPQEQHPQDQRNQETGTQDDQGARNQ